MAIEDCRHHAVAKEGLVLFSAESACTGTRETMHPTSWEVYARFLGNARVAEGRQRD
jgi:hypothetical protein